MTTAYRFKFTKGERVKFIGHLDVMQAFQRSMKRANLPIAYSQGFNPHQQISFAAPLSLGYTSDGEYGDFKLSEDIDPVRVMEELNAVLPMDIEVKKVIRLREGVKNTMASVCAAEYEAYFDDSFTTTKLAESIDGFLKQEEIKVMKKTKKGIKETDIKPDIIRLWMADAAKPSIRMVVFSGSVRNLKPESVAEGLCIFMGKEYNRYKMAFKRIDMFMESKDGELVPITEGVELE